MTLARLKLDNFWCCKKNIHLTLLLTFWQLLSYNHKYCNNLKKRGILNSISSPLLFHLEERAESWSENQPKNYKTSLDFSGKFPGTLSIIQALQCNRISPENLDVPSFRGAAWETTKFSTDIAVYKTEYCTSLFPMN